MHAYDFESTLHHTWHTLLDNPAVGLAVCDLQCIIRHANPAFESLTGIDAGQAVGQALLRMAAPHGLEEMLHNLRRACSGESRTFVFHGRRTNSAHTFTAMAHVLPLQGAELTEGIACLTFALDDDPFAEDGPEQGAGIAAVLRNLGEAAAILDHEGEAQWINPAFTRITGFATPDAVGAPLPFLPPGADLLARARHALARDGFWQGEVRGVSSEGASLCLLATISPMPHSAGERRWLLLFSDLSRQQAYAAHLEGIIQRDSLTGLLNRDAFRERLGNALYRSRTAGIQLAVLFLDLDGFKSVNDTYGHDAGDRVLRQVAERLLTVIREVHPGVDIARIGGDEFAVLIPPRPNPLPSAEALCLSLLAAFSEPFSVHGQSHHLSASIGGCIGPNGSETASELLHCADQAMYRVKQGAERDFFIHPYPSEGATHMNMPNIDFDLAVRRQQIEAYFQPIVDLDSGKITLIEARVRWNGGVGQHHSAGAVVRAASEAQSHWTLDQTILQQAIAAFANLRHENRDNLQVAVNISAATCMNDESAGLLETFLTTGSVKPALLRLEFPLEAFLGAPSTVVPLVQRLAARNFGIAVDHVDSADFKAAHLEDIPVQAIKLHERLVEQAPGDAESAERIRSICLAAQKRGLHVGAEGVVRLEQLEFLRQAGCHEGQGALISRPRTLGDLMFLLRKGRCW